jgi:hypothetical protein
MRNFRRLLIAFVLIGGSIGASAAPAGAPGDAGARLGFSPDVQAAMASIDAERIRAHVKFLADDLLEGRGTGTRGGDIAAHYIASQFELYGLKPAGDDGGYLQRVDFRGVQTLPATSASLLPAQGAPIALNLGEDYCRRQSDPDRERRRRRPGRLRRLRHRGAGIPLERLQGRRRARQGGAGHRQ